MRTIFVATAVVIGTLVCTVPSAHAQSYGVPGGSSSGGSTQLGVFRSSKGKQRFATANDLNRADSLQRQADGRRKQRRKGPSGWAHGG